MFDLYGRGARMANKSEELSQSVVLINLFAQQRQYRIITI
jgi:hypothetical protein